MFITVFYFILFKSIIHVVIIIKRMTLCYEDIIRNLTSNKYYTKYTCSRIYTVKILPKNGFSKLYYFNFYELRN